jgi:hypothetical protein
MVQQYSSKEVELQSDLINAQALASELGEEIIRREKKN